MVDASTSDGHADAIKRHARALGFDACGIAAAAPADPDHGLDAWLDQGFHADMDWIARSRATRRDPALKVTGARSVVVVARDYYHPRPPALAGSGHVSRYAWGRDYHKALKKPLARLSRFIGQRAPGTRSYAEIDTGPVLERAWAARAGIGWIGKNSLVLRRDLGSWLFLGVIITTLEATPDAPMRPHCGSCRACMDACPTGAIVAPGVVDSRKCIAYHTIENRNAIPSEVAGRMAPWLFGCDICQEVCPWNQRAAATGAPDFAPRPGVAQPALDALLRMDEAEFDRIFEGTPVRRAKYAGMLRNARIVAQREDSAPGEG